MRTFRAFMALLLFGLAGALIGCAAPEREPEDPERSDFRARPLGGYSVPR